MNPRALLAGLALAALVGVTSVVIRGDETPPEVGDVPLEPSKAVPLRDGGSGYAQRMRAADGGEVVRLVPPECARRLADAGVNACRRRLDDGGVIDPGTLNRFSADASVGTRCQLVACGVYAERLSDGGDPANEEETVLIERTRDAGAGGGR